MVAEAALTLNRCLRRRSEASGGAEAPGLRLGSGYGVCADQVKTWLMKASVLLAIPFRSDSC